VWALGVLRALKHRLAARALRSSGAELSDYDADVAQAGEYAV